ncbi:cytochrome p450 [Moniliophthora roreri MCA 2997]|uniref:Cytochrome p450 n=1 Tax=Moniliophthora roreri (strain MCA 2997) TaxID=1381753 RepID=V2WZ12_MONRO|nr:cytochrome p450 [Moniliophthora roreri MCA 2997]
MAMTLRLADCLASATFLFILALWIRKFRARRSLDLPPGPKRLPLLGNLLDMPTASEWETYHRWCKELDSDIIHLDVAGTSIIVLDSAEAATDLLEKRPMIYSSRPRCVMINELMGWERNFGFMKYCEQWRIQRRLFDRMFNRTASRNYQSQEARTTRGLLKKLLKDPDNLFSHLRYHASTIILSIAYGIEVLPEDDPHVAIAEEGVRAVISAARPGAFLVESLPFLKYVPSWMPGAGWKRQAKEWYRVTKSMADMPFETAKARIAQGTIFPSFTLFCHQQYQESRDPAYHEDLVKDVAVAMFSAGSDTTVSLLETFFLAMLANPEAQKKAQEEIDRVVKAGHLPDFLDQESLPFVTAILKETFRWQKILPNGVPHCLDADDVYKGYRIPAGSIIIANSWAMLHDEASFLDNLQWFLTPDGKLDPNVTDPALFVFGFGKRICPGRHMAYASAWSVISSILTVFNIEKATNSDGSVVEPTYEYGSALVSHPAPFKCTIKPRSIEAEKLIRELDLFDNMGSARA